MKTTSLKLKDIKRNWYVVDCTDKVIGRVSTEVAYVLQGKHKVNYAPNLDNGDCVVLLNTSKIRWTGKKASQKVYRKHTGFQGGLKERSLEWMLERNPNVILENSIYKMLPKNKMRDVYMAHLYCYPNEEHKHEAQQPQKLEIK
jgi:large subunit ribosomal protein L13